MQEDEDKKLDTDQFQFSEDPNSKSSEQEAYSKTAKFDLGDSQTTIHQNP